MSGKRARTETERLAGSARAHVTPAERQRMRILHARGMPLNAIARELGRSPETVSRHCREMGLAFDRSETENATRARVADLKAERAELVSDYLRDAQRLRRQMWEPTMMRSIGGRENVYTEQAIDRPLFADQYQIVRASSLLFDKHLRGIEFDSEDGAAGAKSLLGQLGDALGVVARGFGETDDGDQL